MKQEIFEEFTKEEIKTIQRPYFRLEDWFGYIDLSFICDVPEFAQSPIVKKVFNALDVHKDEEIQIDEYVNYLFRCLNDENEMLKFLFRIYDFDEDNYISKEDLRNMIFSIVGTHLSKIQIQQLIDRNIVEGDKDLDGQISFEEFKQIIDNFKMRQQN